MTDETISPPPEAANPDAGNAQNKKADNNAQAGVKPDANQGANLFDPNTLGVLNDVNIFITIEVGRAQMTIRDLLNLTKGSIIELDKAAGDPVDIYANGKLISTGTIITANGRYCARVTSIPDKIRLGDDVNVK